MKGSPNPEHVGLYGSDSPQSPMSPMMPSNAQPANQRDLEFVEGLAPPPEGEHPLQTPWSFWFDKKVNRSQPVNYEDHIKKLGSFNTLEGFWRHYAHLSRPNNLPKDSNLHLFRGSVRPMWESFPGGGCWILRIKKPNTLCNRLWEEMLFAAIGEQFESPDVVGIQISVRSKEDVLSIWNRDNEASKVRFRIGEKLKKILHLDPATLIEYKNNSTSMRDGSTFRNAIPYKFSTK